MGSARDEAVQLAKRRIPTPDEADAATRAVTIIADLLEGDLLERLLVEEERVVLEDVGPGCVYVLTWRPTMSEHE